MSGTLSGYISAKAPWPVQIWWTVGAIGLVLLLFFLYMEDTTFDRIGREEPKTKQPFLQDRVATFLPGSVVVVQSQSYLGFLDSIIIGLQPVSILGGLFLTLTFGWAVAVTTLLRYSPMAYAPISHLTDGAQCLRRDTSCGRGIWLLAVGLR